MRENCCEKQNPNFLDSDTVNFPWQVENLRKNPKFLKFYQYFFRWKKKLREENSLILMHENFPWLEENLQKNPEFLKSYQYFSGWKQNVHLILQLESFCDIFLGKIQNSSNPMNIFLDKLQILRDSSSLLKISKNPAQIWISLKSFG